MNDNKLHIDNNISKEPGNDFFLDKNTVYKKSKEEVWEQMNLKIDNPQPLQKKIVMNQRFWYSAASIILFAGITLFLRLHTVVIKTTDGQHIVYKLPDASTVTLNASTTISYNPYWWFFSRNVSLVGEAFFKVTHGSKFTVTSKHGTTQVLGTSFNIFSRNSKYEVACFTGKVKVTSTSNNQVILTPNYQARIDDSGEITVNKFSEEIKKSEWTRNMFNFTSVPLKDVFKEVERQYNIRIYPKFSSGLIYTGHFSANRSVDEVIDLLCKPFGLEYVKLNSREYRVE